MKSCIVPQSVTREARGSDEEPKPVVKPKEAARLLGKSHRTLQDWRRLRIGPKYIRHRTRVAYELESIREFLATNAVDPSKT